MKETESSSPTPEQLLQMLDAGMQAHRARRKETQRNRVAFLTIGIFFILVGTAVAFLVLSQLLHELPRPVHDEVLAARE